MSAKLVSSFEIVWQRCTYCKRRWALALLGLAVIFALWLAQPGTAHADTPVSGTINTPVHWTIAGSPYVVFNDLYIVGGGVLTIDPGVQVRVNDNMWIRVQGGQLNVLGTASNPVVFTAAANRWRYLSVESGSAQITHCVIEKAGHVPDEAALRLFVSGVQVQNCTVRNNAGHGIELSGEGSTMLLENVTVTGNARTAVFQTTINMNPTYRNVTLTDNGRNAVVLPTGVLNRDVTLDSTGITGGPLLLDYDLYVPASTTLTLAPGATLTVDDDNAWIRVQGGALLAQGTADKPITFTVRMGSSASRWRYLSIEPGSRARLDYCIIERTGLNSEGGLRIQTSDVQVRNSTVRNSGGAGIWLEGEGITPTLENVIVMGNNGFAIQQSTVNMNPTYRNVTLNGNTIDAVLLPNGTLNRNVVLDGAGVNGKPFILDYDLFVPANTTLTLRPGTTFAFDLDNVWLRVQGGTLLAEGTATQPITFTAAYTTPRPSLYRMIAIDTGSARLSHCVINSAGMNGDPGLLIQSANNVEVRDCSIYGNGAEGIRVTNNATPILMYNRIYNNGFGVRNTSTQVFVDARFSYWGAANGPHHPTLNPTGAGNAVSDRVLFQPYAQDEAGAIASRLWVQVAGPTRASPGEIADFVVSYSNQTTKTIESAVLVLNLPTDSEYVESTGGGIYWPQKQQTFWKLGALAPGAEGVVTARVRFAWGLPLGWKQSALAQLAGANEGQTTLDIPAYLAYAQPALPVRTALSQGEVQAQIAASADLTALYNVALAAGYRYGRGEMLTLDDGSSVLQVGLTKPEQGATALLRRNGDWATLAIYTPNLYALRETTGGMTMSLQTADIEYWGSWAESQAQVASGAATITKEQCVRNCRLTKLALIVPGLVSKKISWALAIPDCYACGRGDFEGCGKCMWEILGQLDKNIPVVAELRDLYKCDSECRNPNDRSKYVCTSGLDLCAGTSVSFWGRTTPVWIRWKCNESQGMWGGLPEVHYCSGPGEVCAPGYKADDGSPCKYCEDALLKSTAASAQPSVCQAIAAAGGGCGSFPGPEMRPAHDPNAKYGPVGDVLPGQTMSYTVTYENEGSGEAYGVYIVDDLDPSLDENTLVLQGLAQYYPSTRTIIWSVGTLAPKGQEGSTGAVGFTARLRSGLPGGAVVVNRATVYFPSVPEETPTNAVVNMVQPAVATPQNLITAYRTPLAITLSGREVSGLPLTYTLVDPPRGGALTGTPPNLTYTPAENFTGPDAFTFQVSNGASTSRPAQVTIEVTPQGDTTPPQVLWTNPVDGASGMAVSAAPVFTDTQGPVYAPVILIGVSEPLDTATVHAGTVTLTRSGAAVAASVTFDGGVNQIVLYPRAALGAGEYRVTVTTAVKDAAGNALAAAHITTFTIGEAYGAVYLPLVTR